MAYKHLASSPIVPVPAKESTCLLVINCQNGFRNHKAWGCNETVSTPAFDANVAALLSGFRAAQGSKAAGQRPLILHATYRPTWTDHALYPDGPRGPWGANGEMVRGVDFLECAVPLRRDPADGVIKPAPTFDEPPREGDEGYVPPSVKEEEKKDEPRSDEKIGVTHVPSLWYHSQFARGMREDGIKTLVVCGMSTDQHVSLAVREAYNITYCGDMGGAGPFDDMAFEDSYTDGVSMLAKKKGKDGEDVMLNDMMRIILVEDATRALGRGKFDGQTLHDAHIESLRDYAEVRTTSEILETLK